MAAIEKLWIGEYGVEINSTVKFMKLRIPAMLVSALLILGSITSPAINQLNWGLDFTGGTLIEVGYPEAAKLDEIRIQLNEAGFPDAVVQNFGSSQDADPYRSS